VENGAELDWSMGEGLAFGSLLLEGNTCRLSGQDVERGTFSHRHHVLHDQLVDGKTHTPLNELEGAAPYYVHNSHLSEYAVLGFELGFSQHDPYSLVCWEGQFGDFANTAQCIIDQFIASGEEKWGKQAGLTMLLPHGYEGMGPEHSSCRIERFLQMCNDDEDEYQPGNPAFAVQQSYNCNMQIANATTPANMFHLLRRQVHRNFRKPLIVATPKSLLRDPRARSTLDDMAPGTSFLRVIPEANPAIYTEGEVNEGVKRVVFCTGKVYYDMVQLRDEKEIDDVAIVRVEQISPFPSDLVHATCDAFPNAEVVWAQEEPKNMGCWSYVRRRIEAALKASDSTAVRPRFVGRAASASPATGDKYKHKHEQESLVEQAVLFDFEGSPRSETVAM
jgi:2-oxoglutarate dehydrogenase E1 component